MNEHKRDGNSGNDSGFPGRSIGGAALIAAPMLLLAGVLLRLQFHFFFSDQLAAVRLHPSLMTASYSLFAAGTVLMWPAIITLVGMIRVKRPGWALWGGAFFFIGQLG